MVIGNFEGVTADVVLERLFNSVSEDVRYIQLRVSLMIQVLKHDIRFDVFLAD